LISAGAPLQTQLHGGAHSATPDPIAKRREGREKRGGSGKGERAKGVGAEIKKTKRKRGGKRKGDEAPK